MSSTVTDEACGQENGSLLGAFTTDGLPPYEYQWTNSAGTPVGNSADLENVSADDYSLEVTDANGCTDLLIYTIVNIAGPELSGGTPQSASCGNADGAISDVIITGGTGTIDYSWTDGMGDEVGTNIDLTGVSSGSYTLTATDENKLYCRNHHFRR